MEQTFIEENRPERGPDTLKSKLPKANPVVSFFLNRRNQLTLFVWIFALSVPILFYYFLFHKNVPVTESFKTCSVNSTFRVPCGNLNLTEQVRARSECLQLSCCFDDFSVECFHSLPSAYFYTDDNRPSVVKSTLSTPMDLKMYLNFNPISVDSLKVTLSDKKEDDNGEIPTDSTYVVKMHDGRMDMDIFRRETDLLLLTTGLGPMISTENYLEWTFYLGDHLFGLDQLYVTGNEIIKKILYYNGDDHATLPVFMAYQKGVFHSLLIEYSGPVEFLILPSRLIVLRALGEREISFILHTGPTPKEITQFYYKLYEYQVPERWILGPHICRSGNHTLKEAMEEYVKFPDDSVKYASDCFHENLYFMLQTEEDAALFDSLKLRTNKFIMTIFPHVPMESNLYDLVKEVLYINPDTLEPQNGSCAGLEVVYPDYSDSDKIEGFLKGLDDHFDSLGVRPEGYSFSKNWASDDSKVLIENMKGFIYLPENMTQTLSGTLLWNSTINGIKHLYDHNNYGRDHVGAFMEKPKLLSSVFSPRTNTILQVENLNGTWVNLKKSLKLVMSHSVFAHPLISIPTCGSTSFFSMEDQVELCTRWYIMGATMPMLRISSEPPMRDPLSLPSNHARNLALEAIEVRSMLSLYFYNFLSKSEPIVRPTFFEFYENITTFSLDEQYMVGDGLLVAQPFLKDLFLQRIFLPQEAKVFYEFFGGEKYEGDNLGWITLTSVPSDWFMFIRGGKIIPLLQENNYKLAIALIENEDEFTAEGFLTIGDKDLLFKATKENVVISNIDEVKPSLDCSNEDKDLPTSFSSAAIYGLDTSIVFVPLTLDLCDNLEDEYTIIYKTPF